MENYEVKEILASDDLCALFSDKLEKEEGGTLYEIVMEYWNNFYDALVAHGRPDEEGGNVLDVLVDGDGLDIINDIFGKVAEEIYKELSSNKEIFGHFTKLYGYDAMTEINIIINMYNDFLEKSAVEAFHDWVEKYSPEANFCTVLSFLSGKHITV